MGRIKTLLIKRITRKLIELHAQDFSMDFSKNKQVVSKFTDITSPKLRNIIAGYATRLTKVRLSDKPQQRRMTKEEDFSKYYD
ncbi:30S ribosomal protein S17e [Candidatus Woesearchaeota archaeon]|nr:30S ribosomal protein S17e [Candidatus Woesearchaeota archaeon]